MQVGARHGQAACARACSAREGVQRCRGPAYTAGEVCSAPVPFLFSSQLQLQPRPRVAGRAVATAPACWRPAMATRNKALPACGNSELTRQHPAAGLRHLCVPGWRPLCRQLGRQPEARHRQEDVRQRGRVRGAVAQRQGGGAWQVRRQGTGRHAAMVALHLQSGKACLPTRQHADEQGCRACLRAAWPRLLLLLLPERHAPSPVQSKLLWAPNLLPRPAWCRYVWHNGNQYDGEWRAGKMHGQGTLKWVTGEPRRGVWDLAHCSKAPPVSRLCL